MRGESATQLRLRTGLHLDVKALDSAVEQGDVVAALGAQVEDEVVLRVLGREEPHHVICHQHDRPHPSHLALVPASLTLWFRVATQTPTAPVAGSASQPH
eukprot:634387-Rhodomonas_salina.1